MTALLRYQAAILLRSHRWIFPLIAYGLLVAAGTAAGATLPAAGPAQLAVKSTQLAEGLDWSAAMLVPVVAFLTRSMLTAEPDAARACVAAAAGPARAQLAALLTALGGGIVLGVAGACLTLLITGSAATASAHLDIFAAGLLTAVVCLLVGSAAGALCNPPLLRHPGAAMLATLAAAVFALAADVSPASAALRRGGTARGGAHWPGAIPLLTAACLLAVIWGASLYAGARRDMRAPSAT
jgi:hypothetical protein